MINSFPANELNKISNLTVVSFLTGYMFIFNYLSTENFSNINLKHNNFKGLILVGFTVM